MRLKRRVEDDHVDDHIDSKNEGLLIEECKYIVI